MQRFRETRFLYPERYKADNIADFLRNKGELEKTVGYSWITKFDKGHTLVKFCNETQFQRIGEYKGQLSDYSQRLLISIEWANFTIGLNSEERTELGDLATLSEAGIHYNPETELIWLSYFKKADSSSDGGGGKKIPSFRSFSFAFS